MTVEDWHRRALCNDPNIQFEDFPDKNDRVTIKKSTRVCRQCPVRPECLSLAVINNERDGIWAGTYSKSQRDMMILMMRIDFVPGKTTFKTLAELVRARLVS